MNSRCEVLQQNALVGYEERRGGGSGGSVVCPKPRRVVGFLPNQSTMSLRWHKRSFQGEVGDSKAGAELLDLILTKESYGMDQSSREAASTPPFFSGSPPSRVSNPLVQDAQFKEEKLSPLSTLHTTSSSSSSPSPSSPSPSTARKGGCVRMKFGLKPAKVRVEGFDCLSRDRQNSSITAVA